ncbi:MAG: hypothetical protein PF693_11765 [Spirochaetia bacterium]|jgi:uncharacterized protein|nr:hypothetical protein [Spirochaetia bacterium]
MSNNYISTELIKAILSEYNLPWDGIHGIAHWARVMENGQRLAEENGADKEIAALFAVFHDCRRQNESRDDGHGKRGGDFAYTLKGNLLTLNDNQFDLLYYACSGHTSGKTEGDITVRTCWDSDRLDLNRVNIKTDPDRLCTNEAKKPEILTWASKRAGDHFVPEIMSLWKKYKPL